MAPSQRAGRRTMLSWLAGVLLVAILLMAWIAFEPPESRPGISKGTESGSAERSAAEPASRNLVAPPGAAHRQRRERPCSAALLFREAVRVRALADSVRRTAVHRHRPFVVG